MLAHVGKQKSLAQNSKADSEHDRCLPKRAAKGALRSEKMMGFSWISALSDISLRFSARWRLVSVVLRFKNGNAQRHGWAGKRGLAVSLLII